MKKFFAVGLSAVLLLQATVYAGTLSVGAESAEDPVSTVKIADMETVGDGNSFFNYYGRYQDSEIIIRLSVFRLSRIQKTNTVRQRRLTFLQGLSRLSRIQIMLNL